MNDTCTHAAGCSYLPMGFANTYVDQSVSSCMVNQETHEVVEYTVIHCMCTCTICAVHIRICTHHECEVDKI